MLEVTRFLDVLNLSGNVVFEGNRSSVQLLTERASELLEVEREEGIGKIRGWYLPGAPLASAARVMVLPTGQDRKSVV